MADPSAPAPVPPALRPVAGVLWMVASGLCFVGVNAVVRWLGPDLPSAQSAFIRFGMGALIMAPTLVPVLRAGIAPGLLPLYLQRGAVHVVAVILWFYAMARLPVAEITAIGFLNPVLVTLGAALFLGETLALRRLVAIGVAFCGALIVLRPGLREVTPAHLAQVGAAVCFAMSYLLARHLAARATPAAIVAMMSLTVAVGLLPIAVAVWQPVSLAHVGWLTLVALFASVAHYCMMRAFSLAPLTVTQPVTFLQLVWAAVLGVVVFDEGIDLSVVLGGVVILGAVSYITWREARLRRQATPAVVQDTA